MVHLSAKLYQQLADVDWDRYTVLIEDGARQRWTKLAEPSTWVGTKNSSLTNKPDATKTGTAPKPAAAFKQATAPTPIGEFDKPITLLPNELVVKILEFAMGNFDHEAVVTTTPFDRDNGNKNNSSNNKHKNRTLLGVHKRRDWKDIPGYQLAHGFRMTAIKKYGQPFRHGFPYNPKLDTLVANIDEEATFITGYPATSSIIPQTVDQITLKPLNLTSPTIIIDGAMLESFGDGSLRAEGVIRFLRQRWLQALKAWDKDWVMVVDREILSLVDLENFLKHYKRWCRTYHKNLPLSQELLKLY